MAKAKKALVLPEGRFTKANQAVFDVIKDIAWEAAGIQVFPNNFTEKVKLPNFLRVTVIDSGPGVNPYSASGLLIVDIFTEANQGPLQGTKIADAIDMIFSNNTHGNLQCYQGTLTPSGIDKDNPGLYRFIFSVRFTYNVSATGL